MYSTAGRSVSRRCDAGGSMAKGRSGTSCSRHVRYHEADVLEFEHSSAQHLMTLLCFKRDFKPEVPEAVQGLDAKAEDNYFTAKEIAEAASLPSRPCKFSATRMNAGFLALCGPPNLPGFVEQAADS